MKHEEWSTCSECEETKEKVVLFYPLIKRLDYVLLCADCLQSAKQMITTDNKQAATITALRAMLKRLEWSKTEHANGDYISEQCPECQSDKPTHAPSCELDALLKESEAHNATP